MSDWRESQAGREALAARHMDRVVLNEARTAYRPAREVPVNPWGPLPAVCCIWCQANLRIEPHRWWCRPEQYRITMPLSSAVRRDQGRSKRR